MRHSRIQVLGWLGGLLALGACGQASSTDEPENMVSVVTEKLSSRAVARSAVERVSIEQLKADYPLDVAPYVDIGSMRADAIVGWYDKGHNYHEQKMEKNLKSEFGDAIVDPAQLRGVAIERQQVVGR